MKHYYFFLLAALAASGVTATAQTEIAQADTREQLLKQSVKLQFKIASKQQVQRFASYKAGTDTSIISEQPAGSYKIYSRTGSAVYSDWGGLYAMDQSSFVAEMVTGSNGKVWLRNILTMVNNDNWVTGTLSTDGKKLTIDPDQYIAYDQYAQSYMQLKHAKLNMVVNGTDTTYTYVPDGKPITYTVTDTAIVLDNAATTGEGLAAFYAGGDSNGKWANFTDVNTVMRPKDVTIVTPPAGLTTERYSVVSTRPYSDGVNTKDVNWVNVGTSGNQLYISGLSSSLPADTWVVGNIAPDKKTVTFPYGQVMAVKHAYLYYIMAADTTVASSPWGDYTSYKLGGELSLDYNDATRQLSTPRVLVINTNLGQFLSTDTRLIEPVMSPFTAVAATPHTPVIVNVGDFWQQEGDYSLAFTVSPFAEDSTILDPNHLYFRIYLDSTLFTFTSAAYPTLSQDLTEIPINFIDNDWFKVSENMHFTYIQQNGFSRMGVQLVYNDGSNEKASDIAWWQMPNTAVTSVTAHKATKPSGIYDLTGRRYPSTVDLQPGFYIINGEKKMIVK